MTQTAVEKERPLPAFIGPGREVEGTVDRIKSLCPESLHPYVLEYCQKLTIIEADPAIKPHIISLQRLNAQISAIGQQIESADRRVKTLQELKELRSKTAKKPEPLPTKFFPAIARLGRAAAAALLPLEPARTDLQEFDRQIAELLSKPPQSTNPKELQSGKDQLEQQTAQMEGIIQPLIDERLMADLKLALVHISLNRKRSLKLSEVYGTHVSKDPSPNEVFWYVAWVLGFARKNFENGSCPDKLKQWFLAQSLYILPKSLNQQIEKFTPAIEMLESNNWTLLAPPPQEKDDIARNYTAVQKNLTLPEFVLDLKTFGQWGLITTAVRMGIIDVASHPSPAPYVCSVQRETVQRPAPKPNGIRPNGVAVETKPPDNKKRPLPVICVNPPNSNDQLFLYPDGSFKLLVSGNIISQGFLADAVSFENAVAQVFRFKENSHVLKAACRYLPKFQRNIWGESSAGDRNRIKRLVEQGSVYAVDKIRFDKGVFAFDKKTGEDGTHTVVIRAFALHDKFYKGKKG